MDISDSSEDEDIPPQSTFTKFDESIPVKNAEEIRSPVSDRSFVMKRNTKTTHSDRNDDLAAHSPEGKNEFRRFGSGENSLEKPMGMETDPSESEESDDDDIQGTSVKKPVELYNPKEFEELDASAEVKELFQNITRYTPQKLELSYKLSPYIPDFIPAVGDIDAFIKVARPDGVADKIGLVVLDEPCANQSEPAVLHLQLRSQSKSAAPRQQAVIKRIEDAEKHPKAIDKWIDDLNQLHRSKHPPAVRLSNPMPDIDTLMQQWPSEVEDKLSEAALDLSKFDCHLTHLVDITCNLTDIPVEPETRLESLYTLFNLFLEVHQITNSPTL